MLVVVAIGSSIMLVAGATDGREEVVAAEPAVVVADPIALIELPPLPVASSEPGRSAVEESAIALAEALEAVLVAPDSAETCPAELLEVSWDEPGDAYAYGAYIPPLGPPPDDDTTEVNGVVICAGHPYAFMGFEAVYEDGSWEIFAVPYTDHDEDHDDGDDHDHDHDHGTPAPQGPTPPLVAADGPIEGYARYEPQRTCDPTAKPGTVALRDLTLARYPHTRNSGIVRACHIGGRSEHKEGRAFDWGVHVSRPAERAAADGFIAALLAPDEAGNPHALARRMGIMYIIWDRQIWTSYRNPGSWRPYTGASPHIDHVHFSLSWAGAMGRTSFWSGSVDDSSLLAAATSGGGGVATTPTAGRTSSRSSTTETVRSGTRQVERDRRREAAEEAQAAWDAERQRRHEQRAAWEAAQADRRAAWEAAQAEQRAAWDEAQRQRREAAAAERERRAQAEADRRAAWEEAQRQRREAAAAERERREAAAAERRAAWEEAQRQRREAAQRPRRGAWPPVSSPPPSPPPSSED